MSTSIPYELAVVAVSEGRHVSDSQDCSHHIVGESLQTVTEGTIAKLSKLDVISCCWVC